MKSMHAGGRDGLQVLVLVLVLDGGASPDDGPDLPPLLPHKSQSRVRGFLARSRVLAWVLGRFHPRHEILPCRHKGGR